MISGISLLESHTDNQWGRQADYEAYESRKPVLLPLRPSNQQKEVKHFKEKP